MKELLDKLSEYYNYPKPSLVIEKDGSGIILPNVFQIHNEDSWTFEFNSLEELYKEIGFNGEA